MNGGTYIFLHALQIQETQLNYTTVKTKKTWFLFVILLEISLNSVLNYVKCSHVI